MSLYQCEECGCCENTALGDYWGKERKLCSECGKGKWHGEFDKVMLPKGMFITDGEGNLAHRETGDTDFRKFALTPNARHNRPSAAKVRVDGVVGRHGNKGENDGT